MIDREGVPCRHTRDIERLFTGTLPASELDWLYEQIRNCPTCARSFEQYARAEAALEAGSIRPRSPLTAESKARVERRLLGVSPGASVCSAHTRWRSSRFFTWGLAAMTAGVFFAVALPAHKPGRQDTFQARGPASLDPDHGVRALRIRGSGHQVSVEDISEDRALQHGDRIKVLYTELKGWSHVGIRARWPDGRVEQVRAYGPTTAGVNLDGGPVLVVPATMTSGSFRLVATFGGAGTTLPSVEARERDEEGTAIRVLRTEIRRPSVGEP